MIVGLIIVIIITVIAIACAPPPKPIEQIREERKTRYNEAGKDIHEFWRGLVGKDKTAQPAPVPPVTK